MWFWVMYRAKKDGVRSIPAKLGGRGKARGLIVGCVGCVDGVETSLGALERSVGAGVDARAYCNRTATNFIQCKYGFDMMVGSCVVCAKELYSAL